MKLRIFYSTIRHAATRLRVIDCGFTIVETMIVLAVTGGLFLLIAGSLAGKQNTGEFNHAIQDVQTQIQQAISQVSTGFYPNSSTFSCASNGSTIQITSGGSSQGTNQGCVFLGKVIQFGIQGTNPEQYQTFTIAGLRTAVAGSGSPFQTADPSVVGVGGSYASYSTMNTLQYGLTTVSMKSGNTKLAAVGFLMEPGSLSTTSTSGYGSGTQQVDLIPISGTSLGQSLAQGVTEINSRLRDATLSADAPINPASGVQICFASGTTNQSGLVTIGGSGRQLLVTLSIRSNKTCN